MIKVKKSSAGLGIFATEDIKKGTDILEYIGELLPTPEAEKHNSKYLFEVEGGYTIDGKARENTARYFNHSCRPNAESDVRNKTRVIISAKRNIKAGEEICYDYGKEYFNQYIKPFGCRCLKCTDKIALQPVAKKAKSAPKKK